MATPTITLQQFERYIRPHVPNAPDPLIAQYIRLAAIEFSEKTRAWRQIATVTLNAQGQAVVAPPNSSIFEFETVTFNDETPLEPVQYTDIEQDEFTEEGTPCYVTQVAPDTVAVIPFAKGKLTVSCFLRPRHDSEYQINDEGLVEDIYDRVPRFYLTQHAQTIAAGALARLFRIPNAAWSDASLANFYLQEFNDGCDMKFAATVEGQQDAPARSAPDWF